MLAVEDLKPELKHEDVRRLVKVLYLNYIVFTLHYDLINFISAPPFLYSKSYLYFGFAGQCCTYCHIGNNKTWQHQ